jgi:hypothetical protein
MYDEADHSGRAVEGMNRLRLLEHWRRGFESHSRHGYPCVFMLCSCCFDGLLPRPRISTDCVYD